jgi:outer membrane autotransporter protein
MWNAVTFGNGSHGGFQYKAQYGDSVTTGSTPPIRSSDRAELPGLIWDATSEAGLKSGTLHIGLVGGAAESDLDIEGDATLKEFGVTDAGWASLRSWSVGTFALLTARSWYAGTAVGGSWGSSESENSVVGTASKYDVSSLTSSLFVGAIVPIADLVRVDMRGTLGYQRTVGEAHEDSIGIDYSDHVIDTANGSLSARLFGVIRDGNVTARPYLQGGVAHRFHYENELQIADVDFSFSDADTSVFAAGGIDFEMKRAFQLSIGVRQDHSDDFDSLSGRVGLLINID